MLTIIVISAVVVLAVLGAVLALAASRSNEFRVERAATIKAPPERVYALINDLRGWTAWSPWEKLDAAMKRNFSGAATGRGAVYEWEGNGKAGAGRMEITETAPAARIKIKLDFLRPFEGHNVAEFTLDHTGAATDVTWAMHGPQSFVCKVMGLFMSMDRMIGRQFETGLANLKALAEAWGTVS
jgi:uncharacterized protein YndB with AHSA1/START domain